MSYNEVSQYFNGCCIDVQGDGYHQNLNIFILDIINEVTIKVKIWLFLLDLLLVFDAYEWLYYSQDNFLVYLFIVL